MKKKIIPLFILASLLGGCASEEENSKLEAFVASYYNGLLSADYDASFSAYPEFYRSYMQSMFTEYSISKEQFIANANTYYRSTYGDDFKISLSFDDESECTQSEKEAMQTAINQCFGVSVNLEKAEKVECTEHATGSLKTEDITMEWYLIRIDGVDYLYDRGYESE